jgi:hypothetical protein
MEELVEHPERTPSVLTLTPAAILSEASVCASPIRLGAHDSGISGVAT